MQPGSWPTPQSGKADSLDVGSKAAGKPGRPSVGTFVGTFVVTFVVTFEAGALLERIHDRHYRPNEFNPCNGAPTRFAPIQDLQGDCVPSLYAGDTLESAIYETIFHDIPAEARRKTVPRMLVEGRAHGRLEVLRDLKLASLRGPDLKKWRISRDSLTMTSLKLYPASRSLGRGHPPPVPRGRRADLDVQPMRSGHRLPVLRRPCRCHGLQGRARS